MMHFDEDAAFKVAIVLISLFEMRNHCFARITHSITTKVSPPSAQDVIGNSELQIRRQREMISFPVHKEKYIPLFDSTKISAAH